MEIARRGMKAPCPDRVVATFDVPWHIVSVWFLHEPTGSARQTGATGLLDPVLGDNLLESSTRLGGFLGARNPDERSSPRLSFPVGSTGTYPAWDVQGTGWPEADLPVRESSTARG